MFKVKRKVYDRDKAYSINVKMFYRGEIRCVAPSSAINLRSEVKSMKKKRNILKKVLLICCMAGLLFSLTSYENYFEVSAASKASYKIVNKRQVK